MNFIPAGSTPAASSPPWQSMTAGIASTTSPKTSTNARTSAPARREEGLLQSRAKQREKTCARLTLAGPSAHAATKATSGGQQPRSPPKEAVGSAPPTPSDGLWVGWPSSRSPCRRTEKACLFTSNASADGVNSELLEDAEESTCGGDLVLEGRGSHEI